MKVYQLIPENMYRDLATSTNLNKFLRDLFGPIGSLDEYSDLLAQASDIRDNFVKFHPQMTKGISKNLIANLPLRFVRDLTSRKGAIYLRWRNLASNQGGSKAWDNVMKDKDQPMELKLSLLQAEKDRITLNMQMAIIAHIIRQLEECKLKLEQAEELL